MRYISLSLVVSLLLTVGAAAQGPCDTADALLNATLYDEARSAYIGLIKNETSRDCGQNGTLALQREKAKNFYELGQAYEKANDVNAAKNAYIKALEYDPNYSKVQEALAEVNGGILTLAYALYMWALPGLEIIVAGAIVVLVIFFVILFLRFKIYPLVKGSLWSTSLDIGDFDKGATGLEIGKGLGAMVEESYNMLGYEGRMRVKLVTGAPDKLDIPSDAKVAPYFKFVSDFIDWLFPPNVITLSGFLQKPGSLGSGITVTLAVNRTKKILGSYTFWQNEFDLETTPKKAEESIDPTSYYRLAEPVAVWVLFQLGKLSRKEKFTMMGTNDWLSYAYFKAGVRRQLEEKLVKAQQLYVESLDFDLKNWGTLLNLGRMEMEEGQYQHAFERLKMAKEATKSDEDDNSEKSKEFPRNRVWYLATYSLVLTCCYLSDRYKSNLSKAENEMETLMGAINEFNILIQKKDEKMLKCSLLMVEEYAKALFGTIQEIIGDLQTAVNIYQTAGKTTDVLIVRIKNLYKIREAIKTIQKNVDKELKGDQSKVVESAEAIEKAVTELQKNKSAPFEFIMSEAEEEAKNLKDTIEKAKDALKKKVWLLVTIEKAIRPMQKKDDRELKEFLDSFHPMVDIMYADTLLYVYGDKKIDIDDAKLKFKRIESGLTYRGRYNLACYYSILGEKIKDKETKDYNWRDAYRDSLCHLEYALERGGGIVDWANKDPDLKGVRENENTKEDFAKLIKKYSTLPAQVSVEKLPLAGLMIIGETYASQLKEQGIVSPCDLILNAGTHPAREALAKKLGISVKLLHRWALLADLLGIVGDTKLVNLLEVAGFGSIDALKNVSDPCELTSLLEQVNQSQSLVDQTPAMEAVQKWVQDAKKPDQGFMIIS